jgi:hypothetical protein
MADDSSDPNVRRSDDTEASSKRLAASVDPTEASSAKRGGRKAGGVQSLS